DSKNDFAFSGESFGWVDYSSNPKLKEDRITLRLAGEKEISPKITLNGGLSYYFGWVQNYDFEKVRNDGEYYNLSLDGRNWGGSLSVGAAIKLNGLTFEPYLKGAYQDLKTSGDGTSSNYATESGKYAKRLWTVGGGFSVNF
ncbi:MAG TPA: autotransporter domain-containing protein, partial [Syntrophorhabdaceae bacterium]|nr:autotransporter domain-containing protein [Syntrophorhabdaceae bacterium]